VGLVVYTALFGGYDALQEPLFRSTRCDFICFTDDKTLTSQTWQIVYVPAPSGVTEPAMMNRHVKLHPHLYLPAHDTSLYVDANLRLRRDPADLVDKYLTETPFAAPRHQSRNCVYDEIQTCIDAGKADPGTGKAQAERYRREGYPAQNGLTENRVLLRRHHHPGVKALMDAWWAELMTGIPRDQASLQVVCWRLGIPLSYMTEDIICGDYFLYSPHKNERLTVRAKIHARIMLKSLSRLLESR
jgi:hypothetical protein